MVRAVRDFVYQLLLPEGTHDEGVLSLLRLTPQGPVSHEVRRQLPGVGFLLRGSP